MREAIPPDGDDQEQLLYEAQPFLTILAQIMNRIIRERDPIVDDEASS